MVVASEGSINGTTINGTTIDGTTFDGTTINGTTINGTTFDGPNAGEGSLNGTIIVDRVLISPYYV